MAKNKRTGKTGKASREAAANEVAPKGKNKTGAVEAAAAEKDPGKNKDFPTVRSNIAILVGDSAELIVAKVIEVAKSGQLAPAKYLFEAVGLYPPIEKAAEQEDESLAFTLLQRMGIPTKPINFGEDPPEGLPRFAEPSGENERDGTASSSAQEDGSGHGDDPGDAVK